ncbi:MAG: hypothetical protein FWC64_04655 [Treponema sp.]|nr:hypothetical protein [Treponema sp.]
MIGDTQNPETDSPSRPPNCLVCRYFKVTWEPAFPRSCMLFGIKCRTLPSMEVFLSTGRHCFSFEAKFKDSK